MERCHSFMLLRPSKVTSSHAHTFQKQGERERENRILEVVSLSRGQVEWWCIGGRQGSREREREREGAKKRKGKGKSELWEM
jgi:hypothetical protein